METKIDKLKGLGGGGGGGGNWLILATMRPQSYCERTDS